MSEGGACPVCDEPCLYTYHPMNDGGTWTYFCPSCEEVDA